MRLSVETQRKIIQYHTVNSNFSNRKIARMLNVSHNTVGKVINLYQQCGYSYDDLSGLTDIAFQEKLGSSLKTSTRFKKDEPDWNYSKTKIIWHNITYELFTRFPPSSIRI